MPGLGGSNVLAPTTTGNVQAGQANVYQPQQQPAADAQYNNLVNSLISQYTAGATPGQQLYTPATGVAALYQGQADNPFFYNLQQQTANNPYYQQALAAAQQAANFGTSAGTYQAGAYGDVLANVPYQQANLAGQVAGYAPTLSGLAGQTAGYGNLAGGAALSTLQNIAPQMQGFINQVSGNVGPVQGLAGQAAGYAPTFAGLGGQAAGYAPTFAGLGGQAAGYSPLISELSQQIAQTQPQFGALAGQAQGLTPQMQALTGGIAGNIPAVNQLAGQVGGTLPAFGQAASRIGGALPAIGQQQQFMTGLEAQPTGAGELQGAAGRLLQTGFDPQNALFNQLTQQTRDQANAINAASGLAGSPYAAGLTSDALRGLDIQWQTQQLGRQAAATGAAGTALGQAQGLNLGQAALGQDVLGAVGQGVGTNQAALQALQGMGGQAGQAAGLYGQAAGLGTSALGGLGALLGALQGAGGLYGQGAGALSNAISGLGAGAGVLGQAGSLYGGGLGALGQAGGLYGGGLGSIGQAGGLYGGAANIGAQAGGLTTGLGNIYSAGINQLGQAGALNTAAANQYLGGAGTLGQAANIYGQTPQSAGANQAVINALTQGTATAGGLPSQAYLGNLQSQVQARNDFLNALSGVIPQMTGAANIGQSSYQLPQTAIADLANYLQLGRGASLAGGALGQVGTEQGMMGAAGLSGLGTLASPLVFGDQGISGALGLGSSGLLGSLPTGVGGQAFIPGTSDILAGSAAAGAGGGGSGFLGFLSSIFGGGAPVGV